MKALVFAAGLGTRLRPLTNDIPKALVDVGGVAMLGHVLNKIAGSEIKTIAVNIHHFPDKIIGWLDSNPIPDVDYIVSDERNCLLETGGGLAKLLREHSIDDDLLVHNADILTDFPLSEMISDHINVGSDVTLLVQNRDTSRYLLFDDSHHMCGWMNENTGEVRPSYLSPAGLFPFAFGGVHILSPKAQSKLLDYASDKETFSIIDFYIDCCDCLVIHSFMPSCDYQWIDIGKPESLNYARSLLG